MAHDIMTDLGGGQPMPLQRIVGIMKDVHDTIPYATRTRTAAEVLSTKMSKDRSVRIGAQGRLGTRGHRAAEATGRSNNVRLRPLCLSRRFSQTFLARHGGLFAP